MESDVSYSGSTLTVGGDINIEGDIHQYGAPFESSSIPTIPNCNGSNLAL